VGFVVDKVTLGQVFSEYFGFPCQFAFHQLLHIHYLSYFRGYPQITFLKDTADVTRRHLGRQHEKDNHLLIQWLHILETVMSKPNVNWEVGRERWMQFPTLRKTNHLFNVFPCVGALEYPHCSPASCRRRRKGNPVHGGKTGPACHWGTSGPPRWRLDARLMTLLCKNYCCEIQRSENRIV
jgi:hypothetical protein